MAKSNVNKRDDVSSTHDSLERLLHRFREPNSPTLTTIRSIVERLSAELAFQHGDYPSVLEHIANAVESIFDSDEYPQPTFFPTLGGWQVPERLDRAVELAKGYVAHLRESLGGDFDWPAVITCCERIKTLCLDDRWPVVNHPPHIAHEGTGFWDETIGWRHAQLAPDQLRGLYEDRIRSAAESRLSRYFSADGIWAKLSDQDRDEPTTADSTWLADGSQNRLATILNPVQRATEDTLYHLFWVPFMHWARGRDEEYGWLSSLLGNRNFPRLTDYLRVLSSPTGMTYLAYLRLPRSDIDFLTGKPGELRHLKHLRDARNVADHEAILGPRSREVEALYAESLGISQWRREMGPLWRRNRVPLTR